MPEDLVSTAPHELGAHLIYTEHELSPYWALRSRIHDLDGGGSVGEIQFQGHTYEVTLGYQDSGLAPRDDDNADKLHEYRLHVEDVEQPERKADYLVQPRWPDMKTKKGNPAPTPNILGVNVKTQGSNLEPEIYPHLLRTAARRAGLNPDYFDPRDLHPYSNVYDLARYIRVDKNIVHKLDGPTGVIKRIMEVAAKAGWVKYQKKHDQEEGDYHSVTINNEGAGKLINTHSYSREIKCYEAKNADADNAPDELQHPKLEVAYQNSVVSSRSVPWKDVNKLSKELDESVLNLLAWSGLPVTPNSYYIDDAYHSFKNDPRERNISYNDPTPDIKEEQEVIMFKHLREMNESDYDVLSELIEDGGRKNVDALDEDLPWHLATIYRACNRMNGLVDVDGGEVHVASEYLAGKLNDAVQRAERALEDSARQLQAVAEMSEKELERRSSAFMQWARKHGVEVEDPDDARLQLRLQTAVDDLDELRRILRRGIRAWAEIGRDTREFQTAVVHTKLRDGRSVSKVGVTV